MNPCGLVETLVGSSAEHINAVQDAAFVKTNSSLQPEFQHCVGRITVDT